MLLERPQQRGEPRLERWPVDVEVPAARRPRLHDGSHDRQWVPPQEDEPPIREEGDRLGRDVVVGGRLVKEVSRPGSRGLVVEANYHLADLGPVIGLAVRQPFHEVLQPDHHPLVAVVGLHPATPQRIDVWQE